jgi:hypothetical protein
MRVPIIAAMLAALSVPACSECLPSAEAVWAAHHGSHATWRLRLPGHGGEKCWFARGSTSPAAPPIRQVVDPPRRKEADPQPMGERNRRVAKRPQRPINLTKGQPDPHQHGPSSILIWACRCGSIQRGKKFSRGGSVAQSDPRPTVWANCPQCPNSCSTIHAGCEVCEGTARRLASLGRASTAYWGAAELDRHASVTSFTLTRYRRRLLADFDVCDQVACDHGASARLSQTLRLVQDIAAFLRFKSLPIFCKDRA